MRFRRGWVLIATVTLAAVSLRAQDQALQDRHRFRTGIELTAVTATVRDAQGHLVTGLTRDAFEVYEDGERQTITQFTNERVPIGLGLLLDTSDSMFGQRLKEARTAVEQFLFELLDAEDEYFILTFNHQAHVLTPWTSAPDVVRHAMDKLQAWGGTAAYDAVLSSLPMYAKRSKARAALLIISDGADTASDASARSVRAALLRSDAFAYAIAIDAPDHQAINARVNPSALREITDDSGGRTEVVHSTAEIGEATARIAEELNHQYVLGYSSPKGADGKYHSIRVRVPGADYRVRARNGYVAEPR